uniref:Protein kinase domain-containing protein n=1 Tax=Kalanchoe fedtschenkoi TaxID=63787 RepID=A0A7N0TQC3_KALFE
MAVSEVALVLELLRKNGLTEAESALRLDLKEKNELDVLEFERFLFPMLPPVKIPASSWRWEGLGFDVGESSRLNSMSDDEFVSADSSSSNVCSSEFTNPYGVRSAAEVDSDSSSDRLSAFDTARDYHDFDWQTNLHWYDDKDDSHFMTPCFNGSEPFGCPSEDKFIMTSESSKQHVNSYTQFYEVGNVTLSKCDHVVEPSLIKFDSAEDVSWILQMDSNQYEEKLQLEGNFFTEDFNDSAPICQHSTGSVGFYRNNLLPFNKPSLKKCQINDTEQEVFGKLLKDTESALLQTEICSSPQCIKISSDDLVDKFRTTTQESQTAGCDSASHKSESLLKETDSQAVQESSENKLLDEDEDLNRTELVLYDTHDDEYEVFDLSIIHRKNRTGFEENKEFPIALRTMIAGRYYLTEYLGSAAFSKVVEAQDLFTGMHVCLKIIKNDKDFFDQSLDEIKLLKYVNKHDPRDEHHILRLYDYFYHQEHLFIVCELLRANLYEFQKFNKESGADNYFTLPRLQVIAKQCLEALQFLHDLGILHCDLKPENILIKSYRRCEVKIIDLGSSCFLTDNLCLYVQSRSYRAPEVILGFPYDQKIDIWSLGCILAELFTGEVLFPNEAQVVLLARMMGMFGQFDLEMLEKGKEAHKYFTNEFDLYCLNEETKQLEYVPIEESSLEYHLQVSDIGFLDFLTFLLETNPQRRLTAKEALQHPWLSHQYLHHRKV